MAQTERDAHLICEQLHRLFHTLPRQRFPFAASQIPRNGIYICFEEGEHAHGGDRIVRVGTHRGMNQLRARLQQHFLNEQKDRSIFRKNIGRALLNKANHPFLHQWEWDLTSRAARMRLQPLLDAEQQRATEQAVSAYIQQHISFVVFELHDQEHRLWLEKRIIATIASCLECKPSAHWLGLHSPVAKIRESGLWLVQGVSGEGLSREEVAALCQRLIG